MPARKKTTPETLARMRAAFMACEDDAAEKRLHAAWTRKANVHALLNHEHCDCFHSACTLYVSSPAASLAQKIWRMKCGELA